MYGLCKICTSIILNGYELASLIKHFKVYRKFFIGMFGDLGYLADYFIGVECCVHTACCMRKGEIAKMAPLRFTFSGTEHLTSRRERTGDATALISFTNN